MHGAINIGVAGQECVKHTQYFEIIFVVTSMEVKKIIATNHLRECKYYIIRFCSISPYPLYPKNKHMVSHLYPKKLNQIRTSPHLLNAMTFCWLPIRIKQIMYPQQPLTPTQGWSAHTALLKVPSFKGTVPAKNSVHNKPFVGHGQL